MSTSVAVGLLRRGDRLLIARRLKRRDYPRKMEFPGGKVEAGESFRQALARELLEELGVKIYEAEPLLRAKMEWGDLVFYIVDDFEGEPMALDHEEVLWRTPAHIRGRKDLINSPMIAAMDALVRYDAEKGLY